MNTHVRKLLVCLVALSIAMLTLTAQAQTIMSDTFSDGNDDGWEHNDLFDRFGLGTTIYDAKSFEYVVASAQPLPVLDSAVGTGAYWTQSLSDPQYSDGLLRAKVRFDNEITSVFTVFRHDPTLGNGYAFAVNNSLNRIYLDRWENFSGQRGGLAAADFDPIVGEYYILEGGGFGPNLSLKYWRDGDPQPALPQLTAVDSTYSTGAVGAGIYLWPSGEGGVISARFDDISFTVPEPSSLLLVATGALASFTFIWRRRRRA